MANDPMDRVVPLNSLSGYKVADGEPDIRGWDVVASDGRRLGRVDDLLVDTQANKVRYVNVEGGPQGHVTIPIGYARLERDSKQVLVDRVSDEQFQALPAYNRGGPVTRDYEEQVGRACNLSTSPATPDFYEREEFRGGDVRMQLNEEQLAVGTREVS
ncbi:MAG TPA: PRC-barrel domain-containing protein, partial [Longimicrobium sp.]|nr:PRC-barrel domain-containing protein [Longimicrobium sp.]